MRKATLCFLIKGNPSPEQVLLAMKKRGFGAGKWNGVGGKIDPGKGDEGIMDAAVRETKEEIGVAIKGLDKAAVLNFRFPYKKEWDQDVYVFIAKDWEGEPAESEEMRPKWFRTEDIPFEKMWDDDKHWLPKVLAGEKLKAEFIFKKGELIDKYLIKPTNNL